jgi:hypothetical protein
MKIFPDFSVIKRLINLLSDVAREMADSDTVRKQIEKLAAGDLSVRLRSVVIEGNVNV